MKPIEKVPLIEMVIANIKELIVSNSLLSGDKLPTEREICELLQVGRSTVREAFRTLQAMGIVEIKPGRGAFVAEKKVDGTKGVVDWFVKHGVQISDFMEVRMAVESLAVKLAITRASYEEILDLEKIHDNFAEAAEKKDIIKLASYDETFHNAIIKATHNKLLIDIIEKIADAFMEYRIKAFSVEDNISHALEPHGRILEAFKKRDVVGGQTEMVNHLNTSLDDINNVIKAR